MISIFPNFFKDNTAIGVTDRTQFVLKDLNANTSYSVQIQYVTSHGDSVRSDATIFRTDDECKDQVLVRLAVYTHPVLVPPPVTNLHLVRTTMAAARITWDLPDLSACNSFKGYQVFLGESGRCRWQRMTTRLFQIQLNMNVRQNVG